MGDVNPTKYFDPDCDCGAEGPDEHDGKCNTHVVRGEKFHAALAAEKLAYDKRRNKNVDLYNTDCITGMDNYLRPASVQLIVTSIPFGALFMYSGKTEDIGNNLDGVNMREGQFGLHMRFFIEQAFRVMEPGCNVCIHIQQLLRYKNQHGYMGRRDFRGAVIDLFGAGGFEWIGEFVIPKNPQLIAKRLNLHSLMFATGKRNARGLAPAVNDYVMIFQKPGEARRPVRALYDAIDNPAGWVTQEEWIRDAYGTWADILEIDVLEGWRDCKEKDEEKHVCPLQLSVIARCVKLYTNPGELVLDPFMGIGSSAWVCQGGNYHDMSKYHVPALVPRRVVGFELKESYHAKSLRYMNDLAEVIRERERDLFSVAKAS